MHENGRKICLKKIVLVQQKGGAAKTTLCVHLAVASEHSGLKTAIVDTDPQASASGVWGQARGGVPPAVARVLAAELKDALEAADADGYKVVFIDTPPHTAPAIEMVARSVDLAIIPVQPSVLDVAATQNTVDLLRAVRVQFVAVLTRAPAVRDEETIETEKALEALGVPLLTTRICERKAYRRALTQGQAVAEFEPSSKAAHEIATLWKEIQAIPMKQKALKRKTGVAT
jgi:chromosome partitioning protein